LNGKSGGTCSNHWDLERYTHNVCDAKLPHPRTPSFRHFCSVYSVSKSLTVSGERIVLQSALDI
jgi:hypothetical protein